MLGDSLELSGNEPPREEISEIKPEPPGLEATAAFTPAPPSVPTVVDLPSTVPGADPEFTPMLGRLLLASTVPRALGRLAHYEVLRLEGRGAMGLVFQAFDTQLQRTVALKVLADHLAANPLAHRRFLREARAAAAINHPNVVTIHAVCEHRGVPYLVMEYVAGAPLSQRIRVGAPLPPAEVIRLGAQIASGLAAAHALGLVHRDIKPANILIEEGTGRAKITDFGLVEAALDPSESAAPGQTAGTPTYMAPELLNGGPATPRSDLFSLGCVLYAMVAGHSPFQGAQLLEVAHRLANDQPPPLDQIDPRVPPGLAHLVAGLLEKAPEARAPATAEEVAAALSALSGPSELLGSGLSERFGRSWGKARPCPRPGRRRAIVAGLAVALVLMLGIAAGLLTLRALPDTYTHMTIPT
ncbi:MAG: serine/threonine protein kinase, partial [Isosphaeraceae bacterium]|nr:serine/threonine protein kinase [Isosphaeraceae bacterium]